MQSREIAQTVRDYNLPYSPYWDSFSPEAILSLSVQSRTIRKPHLRASGGLGFTVSGIAYVGHNGVRSAMTKT